MTHPDPELAARVGAALGTIADPCLDAAGINGSIVDLGLVQDIRADRAGRVEVDLSLTEIGCAFTHHLLDRVWTTVLAVQGVEQAEVSPIWTWATEQMAAPLAAELRARSAVLPQILGTRALPLITR